MNYEMKELWLTGTQLLVEKKYRAAEEILLKALSLRHEREDLIYEHLVYNKLIDLYYKLRGERADALDKCINYCLADIKILPKFLKEDEAQNPIQYFPPECPSLKRLAIIYEKKKEYGKAMEICELAIELGINKRYDWSNKKYGKREGYQYRLEKLKRKIGSEQSKVRR